MLGAYLLSRPVKDVVAAYVPTGTNSYDFAAHGSAGGFLGPEKAVTFADSWWVWWRVTAPHDADSATVTFLRNGANPRQFHFALPAPGGVFDFKWAFPIPEPGGYRAIANVVMKGGQAKLVDEISLEAYKRAGGARGGVTLVAAVALFPLVFLLPAPAAAGVGAWVLAVALSLFSSRSINPGDVPYHLPGIESLLADRSVFRVASTHDEFLHADYPNVYGLADIRTGGDNLDFVPTYGLWRLAAALTANPSDANRYDAGLRLLGVENVKYLLEPPGGPRPSPTLVERYRGPDMTVLENPHLLPRAAFYDKFAVVPLGDLDQWSAVESLVAGVNSALVSIDPARVLLLHAKPVPPDRLLDQRNPPLEAAVAIEELRADRVRLSVQAPHPGAVFLSDNDFPGWRARLDGNDVPILRSWLAFRAVVVPAGTFALEFSYEPLPLRAGLLVSTLAAVLWAFFYFYSRGRSSDLPAPIEDAVGSLAEPIEIIVVAQIGVLLSFWTVWGAFVYEGGLQRLSPSAHGYIVNVVALSVLAGWGAMALRRKIK